MSAQPETWRVNTPEGIFETDLETLKQWILEGCVLPTDKVCKGNLSWIDAGRVPKLKGAFNGETRPAPEPVPNSFEAFVESNSAFTPSQSTPSTTWVAPPTVAVQPNANVCQNHPDADPAYVCRMCGGLFCKICPKFSSKVPVCPSCGDLCHEYGAVTERAERDELQSSGFGLGDFGRAIRYPFQHKFALVCGALVYAFLLLLGWRAGVVAWMIMFGCISQVISQVAWGRLNRSFMPDFSDFNFWDELVVPAFLGVGIMIVSWGPFIVLVLALMFGVVSQAHKQASPLGAANQAEETISSEDLAVLTDPEADPEKLAEANKKLQGTNPAAQIARDAEKAKADASDPAGPLRDLAPYLGAGIAIGLLLLLSIAWGIFYYPMALTVAGYTQSFGAVLNPIVGLDTIRRMGTTYFKGFGMVLLVQLVSFVIGAIVSVVTAPLTLPYMGNLLGTFITATFTFYFNLVVACILGLSLFKCADRLGINVD